MGKFKNKKTQRSFTRPVIDLGNHGEREWKTVKVSQLAQDDIIANMGKINIIYEACDYTFYIDAGESTSDFFDPDTEVFAFVRKVN